MRRCPFYTREKSGWKNKGRTTTRGKRWGCGVSKEEAGGTLHMMGGIEGGK